MIFKRKIVRDTITLTLIQLFLDSASLFLNVFITRKIGASAIGILSLMGSFIGLAGILSNGNAFLCASRLISEELGKPGGNPEGILFHGVKLCLLLSTFVSGAVLLLAGPISLRFFSGADIVQALRLMPVAFITGAVSSCLKGYFNAIRRAAITAAGDIAEFITKSAVIVLGTIFFKTSDENGICAMMISGIIAGNIISMIFLLLAYTKIRKKSTGKCSISFMKYACCSFPIMGGSILTAVLSSTNDALVPICLRQYGDSAGTALGSFGIFEAIVIPTLFFPSVVLCSISGIIVSESARARAGGNAARVKYIADQAKDCTLIFSVFAAAVLIRFGGSIGELLGGGELAGRMITMIAPVVPFIYMEIVFEAIIKGMGEQSFSSANYLAEYVIRIAFVLVFVPLIGLYGVILSYYASNIFGNCMRFYKVIKLSGANSAIVHSVILPVFFAVLSMCICELIIRIFQLDCKGLIVMSAYTVLWGTGYFILNMVLGKLRLFDKTGEEEFVDNAQQTVSRVL
ncbi:MAG: polysaccharide biosynthesis C-terminal domain-containing protein [Ruminococcus sp.]|nr:polysaccharide biosynthesis C-terminal domain-containing protein [Ruminococcus sp.]